MSQEPIEWTRVLLNEKASFRLRVRALLERIEWAAFDDEPCPYCVNEKVFGHLPDCELAAILKECSK